jgi:L-rhamnose mutarotase
MPKGIPAEAGRAQGRSTMDTIAFRMTLKPGTRDEYRRRHDALWPELAEALREAGIHDYSIFLDETSNHLFAILKRPADHRMDALPHLPVMRRWWDYMAELMETEADHAPVVTPLTPVFHLD